ncbi:cation antiporter [Alicycliphilus sp. B1]|nr:cation antiporter [Alicycliphilus sp. B1]
MMKRLLPAPLVSLGLFVMWLLLNRSMSAGHVLLALVLALGLPLMFHDCAAEGARAQLRRSGAAVLQGDGGHDALQHRRAALPAAAGHAPPPARLREDSAGAARDPNGLAVLAMIVCITPGTAWAELSLDRSMLMLHVLEVDDPQAIVHHVKTCYERPLMEIFE